LIIGFTQALKGEKTTMTKEVAQKYLNDYFQSATKKEAAITKAEGAKFMAENKSKDGVITTESGIEYKVEKEGNGPKPKATDKVKVHYVGTLLDGTEFDSSVKRGQPATFNLSQVIPGWTEGIQLMPVGSKYTFWIPSELAYGDHGTQGIKPGSTLKFEVELLSIEK
ncbi:MAG: FKBP-type peptidyl-prolyl cis-trans isomerase, partial [Bacteroidaceae bacterium]